MCRYRRRGWRFPVQYRYIVGSIEGLHCIYIYQGCQGVPCVDIEGMAGGSLVYIYIVGVIEGLYIPQGCQGLPGVH